MSEKELSKRICIGIIIFLIIGLIISVEIHFQKNMNKIMDGEQIAETTIILGTDNEGQIQYGILETTTKPTTEETTENDATNLSPSESFISQSSITHSFSQSSIQNTTPSHVESSSKQGSSIFSGVGTTARDFGQAFYYDDEEPIYVTAEEYYIICGVVMNETGYGSYEGCVAVAQSIRNQIIREKHKGNPYDIASIRQTYQEYYTKKPNDLVRRAVTDVFYNHIVVTEEPIIAWCNGTSSWHSKQRYVCSYDGNNFYALANKDW